MGGYPDPSVGLNPGNYLAYTLTCADKLGDSTVVRAYLQITPAGYSLTSLVADASGAAIATDPNLVNPWGVTFPQGLPAVVANNASNTLTSYDGAGAAQSSSIPAPVHLAATGGGAAFAPTGIVANGTQDFGVSAAGKSGVSKLIVVGQGGAVAGWSPAVDPTSAVNAYIDTGGAQYTGVVLANNFTGNFLFVTDFHNKKIDVFDAAFAKVVPTSTSFAFADLNLPAGYAPYGIYAINNPYIGSGTLELYITYAIPAAPANHDATAGAGLGLIDVFDGHGNLLRRLANTGGPLNAPCGLTLGMGAGKNYVLFVANAGDGTISQFDPTTGNFLGNVTDTSGKSVAMPGVHSVQSGNRYANQAFVALFVTSGPQGGTHGGYGRLDPGLSPKFHAPPAITLASVGSGLHGPRYLATVTGSTAIASVDFFDASGNDNWSTITAPYLGFSGIPASATVTDVDGNVATATAP
jgi:uncharacterized protein (TIGR03118 family)